MSVGNIGTKERQLKAVELRRQRLTYDQIAEQLGYDNGSGAYNAVKAVLTRIEHTEVDGLRADQGLKLDVQEAELAQRAQDLYDQGLDCNDQYLKTVTALIKVHERRARLFGLDAPVKAEVKVTGDDTSRLILQLAAEVGLEVGEVAQVIDGEVVPPAELDQ